MVKSTEERVKPNVKRNFETPKAETTRYEKADSLVLDNSEHDKIDIVEIPTRFIENFTQKMNRMNSKEVGIKQKQNDTEKREIESPKDVSLHNQTPPRNQKPNEDGFVSDSYSPEGTSPKEDEMSFAAHQKAKVLKGRKRCQTVVIPGSKNFQPTVEGSTPTKIVVVDGTILRKKDSVKKLSLPPRNIQMNSPKSTVSNEEDEIPGIAFCVAGQEENNKKYRLSIYNAPSTENEAGKMLKSLWGNANSEVMRNDSGASSNNNEEDSNQREKEGEEIDHSRKEEENKEYIIRVISPQNSLKNTRTLSEKETPDFGKTIDDSAKLQNQSKNQADKIYDFNFKSPELKKSKFSQQLRENETMEITEFQPFDLSKKEENDISQTSSINNPLTTIPGLEGTISKTIFPKRKLVKQKSVENLTKQVLEKNSSASKQKRPEIPLLKLDSENSPEMSPITKLSMGNEADCLSANFNESQISQNDLNTPQQLHSQLNSVAFFEQKLPIQAQNKENKDEEGQETISLTKYSESVDSPFKHKILEPSPTVYSDISWKKQGENSTPEANEEELKTNDKKDKKVAFTLSPENTKLRKQSKKSDNKYKNKYKKQSKFIQELLTNFQDIKQGYDEMQSEVYSVHDRLDRFEKVMENLQGVITNFATKYKEQNEAKHALFKESQYLRTRIDDFSANNSHVSRDDNLTSTIYLPQKKTIVFSFQKPQSVRENTLEQFKDTSIEINSLKEYEQENIKFEDESPPNLLLSDGTEQQVFIKEPDNNVIKPLVRRLPRIKGEEKSKAGLQILKPNMKYAKDEEKSGFLEDEREEESKELFSGIGEKTYARDIFNKNRQEISDD